MYGKLILKALPWILVFALGFGAAEVYEHKAPWGMKAQRDDLLADLGETRQAADSWKNNRDGWVTYAEKVLEPEVVACRDAAASRVNAASDERAAAASRAFDNGFAAGRTAGRRSCGAPDATPDPAGAGQPVPGGVQPSGQTLAGRWADGAYRPAGDLPAHD